MRTTIVLGNCSFHNLLAAQTSPRSNAVRPDEVKKCVAVGILLMVTEEKIEKDLFLV